jgi:hypothetical protein
MVAVPHPLVGAVGVAELLVGALLEDLPVVEHDDVVDLVEPVEFVGDEQDRTVLGGVQQVRGERLAAAGVQVGGGLIENQQRRVGQERAGQRQALPFTAGKGRPVGTDRVSQRRGRRASRSPDRNSISPAGPAGPPIPLAGCHSRTGERR